MKMSIIELLTFGYKVVDTRVKDGFKWYRLEHPMIPKEVQVARIFKFSIGEGGA